MEVRAIPSHLMILSTVLILVVFRAHVAQDIMPYTCIIEDCDNPEEMYLTVEALVAHVIENHAVQRWTCDDCAINTTDCGGSANNQSRVFESAGDWSSHFRHFHGDKATVGSLNTLADLNKRQMFHALACPLCDELEVDTTAMDTKIDDHILKYLHEFSLLSLPETSRDTDSHVGSVSQESGLLSRTQPMNGNEFQPLIYPEVTLPQLHRAMEIAFADHKYNIQDRLSDPGKTEYTNVPADDRDLSYMDQQPYLLDDPDDCSITPRQISRPVHLSTENAELWQSRSCRLLETLEEMKHKPSARNLSTTCMVVNNMVPEINSIGQHDNVSSASYSKYIATFTGHLQALCG